MGYSYQFIIEKDLLANTLKYFIKVCRSHSLWKNTNSISPQAPIIQIKVIIQFCVFNRVNVNVNFQFDRTAFQTFYTKIVPIHSFFLAVFVPQLNCFFYWTGWTALVHSVCAKFRLVWDSNVNCNTLFSLSLRKFRIWRCQLLLVLFDSVIHAQ